MGDQETRRAHARMEVIFKIEYADSKTYLADYVSNVSGGGVFVATEKDFEVGQRIDFSISFPGVMDPIDCCGEVRWRRAPRDSTDDLPPGIGLSFIFTSDAEAQRIRSLFLNLTDPPPLGQSGIKAVPFRVLLVEENQTVKTLFRSALEKFYDKNMADREQLVVVEAENGHEANEILENESFDLAIIDYIMPDLDGLQIVREIRAKEKVRTLPVIVVSAGGEDAQRAAFEAGADLYLGKPVLLAQLFKSFQLLLRLMQKNS